MFEVQLENIDFYYKQIRTPRPKTIYGGWSKYGSMAKCDQYYKLRYKDRVVTPKNEAADLGTAIHYLLQEFYTFDMNFEAAEQLYKDFQRVNTPSHVIDEAWRIFTGYYLEYKDQFGSWIVHDVEKELVSHELRYSAIPDLRIYLEEDSIFGGLLKGYYLVDYKSKSRMDKSTGLWDHDGEIQGEMMTFVDTYPDLTSEFRGVIVDVIGKQKQQKFDRPVVPYSKEVVDGFRRFISNTRIKRDNCEFANFWPKNITACKGEYICEYYKDCWTGS